MPTPIAHSLAGISVYFGIYRGQDKRLLVAIVAAACAADLDFGLNFLTGDNYHHYFTHSFSFVALFTATAYFVSLLTKRLSPKRDALLLGIAYFTHIALDYFSKDTSAPFGMELFWPFSKEFFIAPFVIFDDIWRGTLAQLLSLHNWLAVGQEILYIGPICILASLLRNHPPKGEAPQ